MYAYYVGIDCLWETGLLPCTYMVCQTCVYYTQCTFLCTQSVHKHLHPCVHNLYIVSHTQHTRWQHFAPFCFVSFRRTLSPSVTRCSTWPRPRCHSSVRWRRCCQTTSWWTSCPWPGSSSWPLTRSLLPPPVSITGTLDHSLCYPCLIAHCPRLTTVHTDVHI